MACTFDKPQIYNIYPFPFVMVGDNTDVILIGYSGGFLGFREDPTLLL